MVCVRYRLAGKVTSAIRRRRRSLVSGSVLVPPPGTLQAYYEAGFLTDVLNSGATKTANYEKVATWLDHTANNHDIVQATSGNQMRHRHGEIPVVYSSHKEITSTVGMSNSSVSINKRAASFFALVEIDNMVTQATPLVYVVMGLAGGVGDLCYYNAGYEADTAVLYWRDGSGTTNTGIRLDSSLSLIGVILDSGQIKVIYNDQSYTVATPLSAGTVTGFNLINGISSSASIMGFHAAVWYDHALDSAELAALRSWAKQRKAVFSSDVSINIVGMGDSIAAGCFAEGNLNAFRRYTLGRRNCTYRNIGCVGNTINQQLGKVQGTMVGWPFPLVRETSPALDNPNNNQIIWALSPTNDVTNGTSLASMIADATSIRATMKAYGYRLIWTEMTPWGSWNGTQLTKRSDFNAAMAALDSRQYGTYVALPAGLQDPTNTTYFDADQVHLKKAGFDLIYDTCSPYIDAFIASPRTSLQTWVKLNGDYTDSSGYERDWQAIGSPSFISGLWGRQALRCTTGGNAARGKTNWREFDTAEWSLMFWFKTSATGDCVMFSKYSGIGAAWYTLKHSTGSFRAIINGMSTLVSSSTYYHDGNWHCVAISVDAVGGKLYGSPDHYPANLTLQASQAWTTVPVVPNTAGYWKAGYDNSSTFNVDFQDCMAWFGSKTQEEFQAISVA